MEQYEYEVHSADENVCGADETVKGEMVGVRFFEAIEALRDNYSIPKICERIGTDVSNFYRKRKGLRGMAKLPVAWLSALVAYYGVSAEWLLLGKGEMFNYKCAILVQRTTQNNDKGRQ